MSHARLIIMLGAICGLLAACGKGTDWSSTSIANRSIVLRHGEVTLHPSGAPVAVISAAGDFSVDGHAVAVTAAQRALLLRYVNAAKAVREHGIATGKAGIAVAGAAIQGIAAGISSGDSNQIDKHVDAKAQLVEQAASKICLDIAEIAAAQDALAQQLPAFAPYATLLDPKHNQQCDHVTYR